MSLKFLCLLKETILQYDEAKKDQRAKASTSKKQNQARAVFATTAGWTRKSNLTEQYYRKMFNLQSIHLIIP